MLHKIVETKKVEVQQLKAETSVEQLMGQAKNMPAPRGFASSLIDSPRQISVIAEVKKASPSKGVIREPFDPLSIASSYAAANVEAMSVLTDRTYFQGSLEYLRQIRDAVKVPLLRKDFIIDELQVVEARANGADCILLIAAILDGPQLAHLYEVAASFGMDVLLEVHERSELDKVFAHVDPKLIGINNRDLRTFETNLQTTAELIQAIPKEVAVVSESGIASPADISFLHKIGARSVLVGEFFMRQPDVQQAVVDLVGERASAMAQKSL